MSRIRSDKSPTRKITIHLDDDLIFQLDQWQNSFGLDSRGLAALAALKAGLSAVPLDTAIFEISQASVKEHRKFFIEALIRFFEDQAAMLKGQRV